MSSRKKVYQNDAKGVVEVQVSCAGEEVEVHRGKESWSTSTRKTAGIVRLQTHDGYWIRVEATEAPGGAWVSLGGETVFVELLQRKPRGGAGGGQSGPVSPMPGVVVRVNVEEGDAVAEGDVLAVVEAMKMEHSVRASGSGLITRVLVTEGDRVNGGALLAEVTEEGGGDNGA